MAKSSTIKHISKCFINPKYEVNDSKSSSYILNHWDLVFLSFHFSQKGLLYPKPKHVEFDIETFLQSLKDSLALTLVHFYPLAGRLVTNVDVDQHRCTVHLDCSKGSSQGARFIHASLDVTVSDILCSVHEASVVHSLFDLSNGEVGHDGHTSPNLSVQVTVLTDGVFIGCSMNHVLADATTFWHFWNVWSALQRSGGKPESISNLPVYERWYPENYSPNDLNLPFIHPNEFISRFNPPELKEKFFSFESKQIQKLKLKANKDINNQENTISSFQALTAFVWKCIVRAKDLPPVKVTQCKLTANNRSRVNPPLPPNYFGNSVDVIVTTTTVGELLEYSLGQVGALLNKSVQYHTEKVVVDNARKWFKSPFVYQYDALANHTGAENAAVLISSSPRFDMYGNEFVGLGKPVAVRSGFGNKFSGKVIAYEGSKGPGSVDFEICLSADCMKKLESDVEFMDVASSYKTSQI